jgi:2-aminoadipate transaminase
MRFSKRMDNVKASAIREILKLTQKPNIISFAGGLPAPELFPVKEIKEITDKILDTAGEKALQYSATDGFDPLREGIVQLLKEKDIQNIKRENVLITNGSQQGLSFSGKIFLDPGDIVLVESPSYLGAINAFRASGCEFVEVETDDHGMIMSDLEEAIKSNDRVRMIYVIPDFQNPTGKTWSLERRKKLIALANEYDLPVIEDNPYGELRFDGEAIPPIKTFDTENRVIYLGTFSKTFCPGLRIGWVLADEEILNKYILLKQGADLHTSSLAQRQIALFLEAYDFKGHIESLKKVYKERRDLMMSSIKKYFPDVVEYTYPEGGLFTWVVLPEGIDTDEMMVKAVEKGVAYVPGGSFFPNGGHKNTMRINYSNMPNDKIVEGIKILGKVIEEEIK